MKKTTAILILTALTFTTLFSCGAPDTANPESGDTLTESSVTENAAETITETTTADTTETTEPVTTEEITEQAAVQKTTERITTELSEEPAAAGGYTDCPVHPMDYHSIPIQHMYYVGLDNFYKWVDSTYNYGNSGFSKSECISNMNIYEFILHFDFPKDDFADILYSRGLFYSCDFDVEVLYSGNRDIVENYYRDHKSRTAEREKLFNHFGIKIAILNSMDSEFYKDGNPDLWNEELHISYSKKGIAWFSMQEIIYESGISRNEVEEIINRHKYIRSGNGGIREQPVFDYDLDTIYNAKNKSEFIDAMAEHTSIYMENLIIKDYQMFDGISEYVLKAQKDITEN